MTEKTTAKKQKTSDQVTINQDQRLFVIPSGYGGFTCFGFKNCRNHVNQLAVILGRQDLNVPANFGTLKDYECYQALTALYAKSPSNKETYFDPETDPKVKSVLDTLCSTSQKVRIHLGDTETGEVWLDEHGVIGTIGRSMGPMRVALLVEPRQHGGCAILTACILRIQCLNEGAQYNANASVDLYRHPKYKLPVFTSKPVEDKALRAKGYEVSVLKADNSVVANFKTLEEATQWIAFMRGEVQTTKLRRKVKAL